MSKQNNSINKTITIPKIMEMKGQQKIVALTAYQASFATILDEYADILLVGDSLGMVIYGMDSTLGVTLDMMIAHGKAVVQSTQRACVIVDMPFGSYQGSKEQAFDACAKVMKETGCAAIKLEGGIEMAETIAYLTARAIPVIAHIGLMPQHVNIYGGYRYQGRTDDDKSRIKAEAQALEDAGASIILMECIDKKLATEITETLNVPTIGIGAGIGCDGQIIVTEDMAGLFHKTAKFVKPYANLNSLLNKAASDYADEVRDEKYPSDKHSFGNY